MKKIFLLFVIVLFIGTVSALEFDDWKTYDKTEREYTITNYFGLGKDIANIKLNTPQIFQVGWGYQKVAEFEIKNGEFNYEDIIKGIEFYDIKNNLNEIIRNVDYKYKDFETYPTFIEICSPNIENGTLCSIKESGTKQRIIWKDWTNDTLLKRENITIGIFTEVQRDDTIEWIINVYGNERLTKWAIFNASIDVGLVGSYPTNESSGTTIQDFSSSGNDGVTNNMEDLDWTGSSLRFDGVNESGNLTGLDIDLGGINEMTVALNFSPENVAGGLQQIIEDLYDNSFRANFGWRLDSSTSLIFNSEATAGSGVICAVGFADVDGGTTFVNGEDHVLLGVLNTTGLYQWIDGTFIGRFACTATGVFTSGNTPFTIAASPRNTGSIRFFDGGIGRINIWNRSLNNAEAIEVTGIINGSIIFPAPPSVTLNSPIIAFNTTNKTIVFNGTVVDSDGIINVTLFIDGILNETNSSGINNTNYLFTKTIALGNHNWTFEACDNVTGCTKRGERIFSIVSFVENSQTFNSSAFETELQRFTINITTNGSTPSSAKLIYNGTTFSSATITSLGGNDFNISRAIDIPLVNGTKSFFFNVTIDSAESSSTTQNQIINSTDFTLCSIAPQNIPFINITFKNETVGEESVNAEIDSDWIFFLGSGTVLKTLSFTNTTENNNYTFCSTPSDRTLTANVSLTYDNSISEQRSFSRTYSLTNTTTEQTLFLLPTADGVFVTFQTITVAEQVISGVASNVTKGTDLISTGITDDAGLVQFFLDPDTTYVFKFFKAGFDLVTTTLKPTQSSFTIIMGAGAVTVQNDTTKGISYTIRPLANSLSNNTEIQFNLTFSSIFFALDSFGFVLKNSTGDVFNITTSTIETGGFLSRNLNTGNNTDIQMEVFWTINGNQTNVTRLWKVLDTADEGFSIKTFFDDLSTFLNSGIFGLTNFGLGIIVFMIIIITTGVLSTKFGITSPAGISIIVFSMVLFFDVGLGIIPNPIGAVPNFPTIFIGIIFLGLFIKEAVIR